MLMSLGDVWPLTFQTEDGPGVMENSPKFFIAQQMPLEKMCGKGRSRRVFPFLCSVGFFGDFQGRKCWLSRLFHEKGSYRKFMITPSKLDIGCFRVLGHQST